MFRIKELRKAKGINMKEAAQMLNMPYTTYVNYEKGLRKPTSEVLIQLATFYETSVDYIVGHCPDPSPASNNATSDILDEIDIGFYGDYKELTEDDKAVLREMARVMLERRQKNTPQD